MKKVFIIALLVVNLLGMGSCSDKRQTEQSQIDAMKPERSVEVKTFESVDGWTINYPSSWNKAEVNYIQEEKTGKTLTFNTENTSKEDLEKWIDSEIKRKLAAPEALNTLKNALSVKQDGELWYYTYTIHSKSDSYPETLLKTTVIFDGQKKYEFGAALPPVTETEYSGMIESFKVKK